LQIRGGSRIITGLFGDAERRLPASLSVYDTAVDRSLIAQFKEMHG
jgi:hypothetical protein